MTEGSSDSTQQGNFPDKISIESNSVKPVAYQGVRDAMSDLDRLESWFYGGGETPGDIPTPALEQNDESYETWEDPELQIRGKRISDTVAASRNVLKQGLGDDFDGTIRYFKNSHEFFNRYSDCPQPEIIETINEIFLDNIASIDLKLDEATTSKATSARTLWLLTGGYFDKEKDIPQNAVNFISKHLDAAMDPKAATEACTSSEMSSILSPIFENGSLEQIQNARTVLHRLFSKIKDGDKEYKEYFNNLAFTMSVLYEDPDPNVNFQAEFLMKEQIRHIFGMDYKKAWTKWLTSDRSNTPRSGEYRVRENYQMLCGLEFERPGIGRVLSEEFGVFDFSRYPKAMLIRQYDERDNANLLYGIVLYPEDDNNGAFYHDRDVFSSLADQLGNEHAIRIYEASNMSEVLFSLNSARHRYGKSEFLILGAHGTWSSMRLGIGKDDVIQQRRVRQAGAHALQNAFVEFPTIILNSCSTGELEGIGMEISKLGTKGATVIAPDRSTGIKTIKVEKGADGKLEFKVEYHSKEGESQPAKTYNAGQ